MIIFTSLRYGMEPPIQASMQICAQFLDTKQHGNEVEVVVI